jgi:RNA polymerase sigma factor (sigma-70 family)
VESQDRGGSFERDVLPHLDAASNLARWLTGNDQDAKDLVQEACLRALRFFSGFRGRDARGWLLKIVRNAFYSQLEQTGRFGRATPFDEEIHGYDNRIPTQETFLLRNADSQLLMQGLEELPPRFRELLVLRELEGLSYREIAHVADIPLGTVMSSLSRARERLRHSLTTLLHKETHLEQSLRPCSNALEGSNK